MRKPITWPENSIPNADQWLLWFESHDRADQRAIVGDTLDRLYRPSVAEPPPVADPSLKWVLAPGDVLEVGDSLQSIQSAIQAHVNADTEGKCPNTHLVDNSLVVWEQICVDENGVMSRSIQYSVPSDNFTPSGTLGLLEAAREYVRQDLLEDRERGE